MKHTITIFALAAAAVSQATVLTFDIDGMIPGQLLSDDYGDNVTAATMGAFHYDISNGTTPDVDVSYVGAPGFQSGVNWYSTGYSDLTNVIEYEHDGAPFFTVVLTASGNNNVVLNSFDLGNWGGAVTLAGLTVQDGGGNTLWSMTNISVPNSSEPHLSFDVGGVSAQSLTLEVDLTGLFANSDNIGLDNISFNQEAVPEPVSMVGLAAFAFLARKRKK